MSQWTDRIENHAIWSSLASIGPLIDRALNKQPITPNVIDALERIRVVLSFCGKRLASTDPALLIPALLDTLNTGFVHIQANLETFISNGDGEVLLTANTQADFIVNNAGIILGTNTPEEVTLLGEVTSKYRSTLLRYLKEALSLQQTIEAANAKNEAAIALIANTLSVEQQRIATILSEQQSQFSSAQDKRSSDFATTQAEYLSKFTLSLTDQQTQFANDQNSRRTTFSEFQTESQASVVELVALYDQHLKDRDEQFSKEQTLLEANHQQQIEVLHRQYQTNADEILTEMQERKLEIQSLVGVIGNAGVTYGYKKVADQARRALYFWQGTTVLSLLGLITVAFFIAFPNLANTFSTIYLPVKSPVIQIVTETQTTAKMEKGIASTEAETKAISAPAVSTPSDTNFYHGLATRIFLSLTFGIFAAYAGKQAAEFFKIEQKNRKLALELEALGPFIEPLEKADRDKFRVQIGDRSFGVPEKEDSKEKDMDPVFLGNLLKSKELKSLISSQVKAALKKLNPE